MKAYKIIFIIGTLFFSCEDYLDYAPKLEIDETDVYKNYRSALGYLDNCYAALENNYSTPEAQQLVQTHIAAIGDEGALNVSGPIKTFNTGDWFNRPGLGEVGYNNTGLGQLQGTAISNSFYSIRIANNILKNVPEMTNITATERNNLLGQAYFYRSWAYFQIIKRWGGMQIFDKAYATDEWRDVIRLSYQESTNWLIEGYNEAINRLPSDWDAANTGRPTKVAAYAARSMAALYAASPLMNNPVAQPVSNRGYNQEWSEKAAQYAHETLRYIWDQMPQRDMQGLGAGTPEEKLEAYRHIFYHKAFVAPEHLWYHNSAGLNRDQRGGAPGRNDQVRHFQNINFSGRPGGFGQNLTSVTQNLVDKFEVINPTDGLAYPFGHPSLGSLEAQWVRPYDNRDPRFYNNILFTGGPPHGAKANGDPWYLEVYPGGADFQPTEVGSVKTGYMCKKWWWPTANRVANGWGDYYYNAVFIRATQVYLDYAEAMNEAYGPNADPKGYGMTAVQAINKVRNRVGMVDVNPAFTGSKEAFRERIRNERAVELMWEDHRWHDMRRWMIAHEVLGGPTYPIQGVVVQDLTPLITNVGQKSFRYTVVNLTSEIRVFEMKHYWYPLPRDHMERLRNVTQNPGW
jgi:starch-binding outer membrane protein, SusD/RagB family